jgi:Cu2+-exporting ATPase
MKHEMHDHEDAHKSGKKMNSHEYTMEEHVHDMVAHDHQHMHHDMSDMNMDMSRGDMGMDHNHAGGHMMHMGNMNRKLVVSLILTIPVILLAPIMGIVTPVTLSGIPFQAWLLILVGSVLYFYGGSPFSTGAVQEIKDKRPAMMTLISMGISVAYFYSVYQTIVRMMHPMQMTMDYFFELATLIDIMLIGHIIEMNAVMKADSAVTSLAELVPKKVHIFHKEMNHFMDVDISTLKVGDRIMVKGDERIPVDGIVISGNPEIDESVITGESGFVSKIKGDKVTGGSLNSGSSFEMEVTKTVDEGFLSQVQQLVTNAQAHKSNAETLADRVAGWLFYFATGAALIALVIWSSLDGVNYALPIVVAVLVIACPHALGLAVPLVVARYTNIAASNGLLIQDRNAVENMSEIKYVLMDKTGTLTTGIFEVKNVVSLSKVSEDKILGLAAALEMSSTHPLAKSIIQEANVRHVKIPKVTNDMNMAGVGVMGTINKKQYQLVNFSSLDENQITPEIAKASESDFTVSYLIENDQVIGFVQQGDTVRPNAVSFIQQLKANKMTPVIVTGDNSKAAEKVAVELGITDVFSELKPQDKIAIVERFQQQGKVMMIGDGVNDAPALAQSDLGIAIGAGTDVAANSADVILVKSSLLDVLNLVKLTKRSHAKMTENLWWGAGYNLIAIPLAAGILIPVGFTLNAMVGAVLMSASTVIVALNAMSLKLK